VSVPMLLFKLRSMRKSRRPKKAQERSCRTFGGERRHIDHLGVSCAEASLKSFAPAFYDRRMTYRFPLLAAALIALAVTPRTFADPAPSSCAFSQSMISTAI